MSDVRLIVDVPSVVLTAVEGIEELVAVAENAWGKQAASVVYPATWIGGLTVEHDTLFAEAPHRPGQSLDEVVDVCRRKGWGLWLDVDLDLKPVRSDLLHIKDFYGGSSSHACINCPATHRALDILLREVVRVTGKGGENPLAGVVMSVQNLWPMSGSKGIVELNCFCHYCRSGLERHDPGLLTHFEGFPNPWNLVLNETPTGIDHVNAFPYHATADQIVNLSRAHGLLAATVLRDAGEEEAPVSQMRQWAEFVLKYARARHKVTIESLARLRDVVKGVFGAEIVLAATLSDFQYDWIAGIFLDEFDRDLPVDEMWIDPNNVDIELLSSPHRYYLWERTRYYINHFYDILETTLSDVQRTSSELTGERIARLIRSRGRRALTGMPQAPIQLMILPPPGPSNLGDVVVAPLSVNFVNRLIQKFGPEPEKESAEAMQARLAALLHELSEAAEGN